MANGSFVYGQQFGGYYPTVIENGPQSDL